MPEENQRLGKSVAQLSESPLRSWANSIIDFQKQARQEQMAKASAESENNIKNLMVSWMTTTNHWVSQDCDRAARIWLVAKWVRDYFGLPENWWIDYSNVPDVDLVDSYKASNPDSEEAIWQFVLDDSQICDPNPLYQELGFYWEPQVEETVSMDTEETEPDNFVDWMKNVGKSFLSFVDTWWDFVRNVVQGGIWLLEWDQTPWALENYADMNYWTDFYSLTDEQKQEARDTVSTKEWLDTYKPTTQRAILKWMETWLDALFTIWVPTVKWMFSVWENTPWLSQLLEVWGLIFQWGGWIVNHTTPLYFFRNTLQTEEEKQEFDSFVGTLWFMKRFQKRGERNKWNIKETLLKEIDPEITIKEFQQRIRWLPSEAREMYYNARYWKPTQENLQEAAWLIAKPKTTEESVMATNALRNIDLEWVKDYVDLDVRFNEKSSQIKNAEDALYELDTRKFKPEDDRDVRVYEMEWEKYVPEEEWSVVTDEGWERVKYGTVKTWRWIQPMIDLLKIFYEWNMNKSAYIEMVEQKFKNEWLTRGEINHLTRDIAAEYESYTKRWKPKETIEAQDVEWIRQRGKIFARWTDDMLVELDREWSNNMNTQQMIKDLRDEIVRTKATTEKKNLPQKAMWVLWEILKFTWVKSLLYKLLPNAVWEEKISPLTREKNLKKYIKKFQSLNERLNWTKSERQIEKIVNDFMEDLEKDIWPIEWEVITNETNWEEYKAPNNRLEEVVQSENIYPESKMLQDNWKNNAPIDFTTMPWIDPKWNVFKWFREIQEIDNSKK